MGYVPDIPDVPVAWAKLMNALFGSLFFATIGAGAFAGWFIPWARDRGESILADHHDRGVEIVEYDDLKMMIDGHNLDRVRTREKEDRKSVGSGTSVPVRVDRGGRGIAQKNKKS